MTDDVNRTIEELIADLIKPDKFVFIPDMAVARSLAKIGRPAVKPLLKIFYGSNPQTRSQVSKAIKLMGNLVFEEMLQALNHSDSHVRLHSANILGDIGDLRAVEPLIARLAKERTGRLEEILNFWKLASSKWRQQEDGKSGVRMFIVTALGKLRDARAVATLISHLDDPDDNVEYGAGRALGYIGDVRAFEPLVAHLNGYAKVSGGAAIGLGLLGDARAIKPLIEIGLHNAAEYRDLSVRECASDALAGFGELAIEPLIQTLKDQDAGVRVWAVRALGKIGNARGLSDLERLKNDNGQVTKEGTTLFVAQEIHLAIIRINLKKLATPELLGALKDTDAKVREVAADYLKQRHDSETCDALIDALDDPAERVCWHVVEALGKIGDPRAIPKLKQLVDSQNDFGIRFMASSAIERIRQQSQQEI